MQCRIYEVLFPGLTTYGERYLKNVVDIKEDMFVSSILHFSIV